MVQENFTRLKSVLQKKEENLTLSNEEIVKNLLNISQNIQTVRSLL